MWMLRWMKVVKVEEIIILEFYLKEIRPLAEHGVAVWNPGLTVGQVRQLEEFQKVAFFIIFEHRESSYLEI